ncbi:hypothetical protein GCM10007285_07980 [Stappia taiwanensis]|nr:hypothetical protein GCM10007285_07980 [Stappia taiwanensis]
MPVSIGVESPLTDEMRELIAELNAALLALTPTEHCYHMSVEEMAGPATSVFVAREEGRAIGCGALRRHPAGIGELKRMFTRPEAQGRGIGGLILERALKRMGRWRSRRAFFGWCWRPVTAIRPPGASMSGPGSFAALPCLTIPRPNIRFFTKSR